MDMNKRRLPYIYAGIWAIIALVHILIMHYGYQLHFATALAEGIMFNLSFSLIGIGLWYMVRYSDLNRRSWLELLFVHLSGLTVVLLLWIVPVIQVLKMLFWEDADYMIFLQQTITVRVITGAGLYLGIVSLAYLLVSMQRLKEQQLREAELKNLLKESELNMLRFQINPHFLFNSLNAISSLILMQPSEANRMVIKLSEFMRYSLDSSGKIMSSLGKEVEHCSLYLDIEQVRFGERLKVDMHIPDDLSGYPVPSMLLQPLLENAVKHGLDDLEEGIRVAIEARREGEALLLSVGNPVGESHRRGVKGTGTGLNNIRARFTNLYGRSDLVKVLQSDSYFQVDLMIPQDVR
jgi:two-component system, LytTR family, sensor kinase